MCHDFHSSARLILLPRGSTARSSPLRQASLDDTTLYTLEDVANSGDCGQVAIKSTYVKPAQALDKNLKVGTCASVGYTVADGTISKKEPIVGTLTILKFKKPSPLAYAAATKAYDTPKFSFSFTGDGCNGQCPKSGCYEQDNGCEYCLAAWRSYPPDSSYKYNPIVDHGCAGKLVTCAECPPGLTRYDK